jgi:hypothetical protein
MFHTEPVIQRTAPYDDETAEFRRFRETHPYEVVRPTGNTLNSTRFSWHATLEDAEVAVAVWHQRNATPENMDRLRLALIDALEKRAA